MSERTLRRKAYRIGYRVEKGVVRHSGNICRDCFGERFSGYMIRDIAADSIEAGCYNGYTYQLSLNDVELFLRDRYNALGLAW